MLTPDQKKQLSELLEELGRSLDITEPQFNAIVQSYQAVGKQLSKEGTPLHPYNPEILPQGSFLLGTMIKPINENDDLDIDVVCQLTGKQTQWTQYDLKQIVGNQLKSNEVYLRMLKEEGRRCWTLLYSEAANYHIDILPAIVNAGYRIMLERSFSDSELSGIEGLAIRITDKHRSDYNYERNHLLWLKSNPFGYGRWFFQRAALDNVKVFSLREAIKPVPGYQEEKLPLQRVVQILKRHRDMMFNGDEHKPISIIITTLAAHAYSKEDSVIDALLNVIRRMPNFIEERVNPQTGKIVKWVANPVNPEENFADKWEEVPKKEDNFNSWLVAVRKDMEKAVDESHRGPQFFIESIKSPFGEREVTRAFTNYGKRQLLLRESGVIKMASGTGMLGVMGRTTVPPHTNYGGPTGE